MPFLNYGHIGVMYYLGICSILLCVNNTLPNATNTFKWKISKTDNCENCFKSETLGHVVSGCKVSLDEKRYTWRHDSIIANICSLLNTHQGMTIYADLKDHEKFRDKYLSPSTVTGEEF